MSEELTFEQELDREVTSRLSQMEDPSYEFPERMRKIDWALAAILGLASLATVEFATLTAGMM